MDPNQPTGDLKINGIVYNEVKTGWSAPSSLLHATVVRELLPNTCYARNGSGDSRVMPNLNYEQFKTYHQTYYHPSNSYFFFYGNTPTNDYLVFLADKLAEMSKTEMKGFLQPLQPEITHPLRWETPRIVRDVYPIDPDDPLTEKTYLMLSWLIGDRTDPEDTVLCRILRLILLGNEGSPLRKAIIDSKLGADLFDIGFLDGITGPHDTFHIGLVGTEADRVEAFTELVVNTLTQIANTDIDTKEIEAALQQITYNYQEVTPAFPFQMMVRVINTWIYEKEPTLFLKMGNVLSAIRQRWEQNPRLFNDLIRERLLDNPHRLTTILSPDPGMQAHLDTKEDARLKTIRSQLTDEQMVEIAADAAELERLNGQPNSPDDLAKLPQLHISDLPEKPLYIPTTVETVSERPLLRNNVFSNGVNYLVLNFDLQGLPQHLWQYLPRYTDAIGKLGASNMNYEQIAQRTAGSTGELRCTPSFSTHVLDPTRTLCNMQFQLKALDGKMEDALDVLHDLVCNVNPRDIGRLRDVLSQAVTDYRTSLVNSVGYPYGSILAARHAARGFSPQAHLSEIVFGLPQLHASEMLLDHYDKSPEELCGYIEQIRDFLLVKGRVTASFTGSNAAFEVLSGKYAEWIGNMRDEPINPEPIEFKSFDVYPREGLATPMQIANCMYVTPAPHYSHPDSVLLMIGAHILDFDYSMPEIRLKGNAYMGTFIYNPFDALLYQASYADPHISRTLNVFEQAIDYLQQVEWTQTDIDRAIIATATDYQQTIRSSQASTDALTNHLTGQTDEILEERYAQLRRATPKEVKRALLQTLEENVDKASICVIASREKLEAENQKMAQPLSIENILE